MQAFDKRTKARIVGSRAPGRVDRGQAPPVAALRQQPFLDA